MTEKTKKQKTDLKFDYKTIRSFEDACNKEGVDPEKLPDVSMIPEDFQKPVVASYKLMIIYQAINNGWRPDWNNRQQYKYFPWLSVLSSGFGFSGSGYYCTDTIAIVGSRLCFESEEKSDYAATQFIQIYKELLTLTK